MSFNGSLFIWWVLYITNQYLTEGANECVQRRLGACKVLPKYSQISLKDFHSPQPEGFALKTSMEINLLDNKHNFENNLPVERKRPIGYNLDNAALVTIVIYMNIGRIKINLGKKYYRLAELNYYNYHMEFSETKYNRYTPSLPTFPYNLHLEITTNGTLSVYEDANTEPFFKYQLTQDVNVDSIDVYADRTDLIVFADCSVKDKPNCGSHRVDRLYDFTFNSIEAKLLDRIDYFLKGVRTKQWFEVPASPYAVRVLLTTGENSSLLEISNLRRQKILSLNLCVNVGSLLDMYLFGPNLYLDCLHELPRKIKGINSTSIENHDNDYTKELLDTRDFVSEPFVMYHHEFGNTTQDWCKGPKPEVLVTSKYHNDSVQAVIETSNAAVLTELKEINAQNTGANTAVLTELEKISKASDDANKAIADTNKAIADTNKAIIDTNEVLLAELRSVKASIDALATHKLNE